MLSVEQLQKEVEAESPATESIAGLRRRLDAEDARRRDLVERSRANEPLKMLNALSEAIPKGAWVEHLEWNGHTLHVVGYKPAEFDLNAALRGTGDFSNARAVVAQAPSSQSDRQPFDVTADARQGAGR